MNSKQLVNEMRKGAEILHNGAQVSYSPRHPGDRTPWVFAQCFRDGWRSYRYTAAQCVAHYEDDN